LDKVIAERRSLTSLVEQHRHQLKKGSDEVARLKKERQPADEPVAAMKELGNRIQAMEEQLREAEARLADLALRIPNVPHDSVPPGKRPTRTSRFDAGGHHRISLMAYEIMSIWGKRSAFWISTARQRLPAPDLPSCKGSAPNSSAR
jgi:seryl-tRNA synthetase